MRPMAAAAQRGRCQRIRSVRSQRLQKTDREIRIFSAVCAETTIENASRAIRRRRIEFNPRMQPTSPAAQREAVRCLELMTQWGVR